jgi:hypothetical protein
VGFKLNVLTGQLDLVNSSSGSGNVTGVPPTDINAIARWDDTTGTTIKNSPGTYIQDSGAIVAQAHITNTIITGEVTIDSDHVMITSGFTIEPTGELVIESDGELVVV